MSYATGSSGRGPADKSVIIKGQLRGKFMARDRLEAQLQALDIEIATLVRQLADHDKVPFLRTDNVRRLVLGETVTEEEETS